MNSRNLMIFDISGEYGHFRKFNTTSSPLTYLVPTRTALAGILGAILGVEREIAPNVYPENTTPVNELFSKDQAAIAIQILQPANKVNIGFNLLDTGKSGSSFFNIKNRTQIEFELLKNPAFRIFFSHNDEGLFNELNSRLKKVNHFFTPYLGLSQFTATVNWIGEESVKEIKATKDYTAIHSILNLNNLIVENPVKFGHAQYVTDTMPMEMQRNRVVTEYAEILLEKAGNPIEVRTETFWETSKGKILFL